MILLVEDNHDDAALIVGELKKQLPADSIRHAVDGNQALELLRSWNGDPVQLILLDLELRNLSGLEVLKQLRASNDTSHIPVVMLSGSDDLAKVARSYDLGANSVINKSTQSGEFAETVSQIAPYWLELNHPYITPGVKR